VTVETPPRATPPPIISRPWWRWLISDNGARYTSRLLALIIWQLAGTAFPRIPTPTGTIGFLVEEARRGELLPNLLVSLRRAGTALSIVLVLGILIGFAMGRWWRVRFFLNDLVLVGIALPAFIWALLGVMWWGFSNVAPIVVCILSATPMLVVNTHEGARATSASLQAMSDAYRVPVRRQFRWLVLPSMMEYIVAGFRFSVLSGWGAVLLVEWFGNNQGAGYRAHYYYDSGNFNGLMGWGLVMMMVIMTFDRAVMDRILRRYRRWRVGGEEWSG
jgi:ABC-type nitrate/sulfonate/bicarbonate transport system permease component